MSFAAKVPRTRRSKYKDYDTVTDSAIFPGSSAGKKRQPSSYGGDAAQPQASQGQGLGPEAGQGNDSAAPRTLTKGETPSAAVSLRVGAAYRPYRQSSSSTIDGRGTPTRLAPLNRPKSIEEISQALGEPEENEDQVVVMVMARATDDGKYRITDMPDSGSVSDAPERPEPAHRHGPPSVSGFSMPDEFFLPMGGSMGPQMTSSRFSQNSPPYYGPPLSQGGSGQYPPGAGPYYPATSYFPTINEMPYTPPEPKYTWWDMCINLLSAGTYLADVGTDLFVAYLHFHNGDWWWFSLTLAFVLVPSLIISGFSLAWYCQDHVASKKHNKPTASYVRWVSRFLFHMLQLGPVIRYIDVIIYGCRSKFVDQKSEHRLKKHWYHMMLYEDADSCLLRLIECFVEAAPQLVLQLYILSRFGAEEDTLLLIGQTLGCLTSLCSLAWSLVAYQRALRMSLDDKANLSYIALLLMFFWHLFIIASRVLALALFAAQFTFWVAVLAVAHGFMMLLWILWQSTNFCSGHRCQEFLFNVTIAAVYIFAFLNLQEGHTRLRYIFYYAVVYFENCIMILTWYMFSHTESNWSVPCAIVLVVLGFLIGVTFQLIYYLCAHPNNFSPVQPYYPHKRIRLCLPCQEMLNKPRVNFSAVELRDVHRTL